jgi:hypothetical protein
VLRRHGTIMLPAAERPVRAGGTAQPQLRPV